MEARDQLLGGGPGRGLARHLVGSSSPLLLTYLAGLSPSFRCCWRAATAAATVHSPAVSPAAAAALLEEGDAAHARCKKLLPPSWATVLKIGRDICWTAKPIIEQTLQRSPNAWQAAVQQEMLRQQHRRVQQVNTKLDEGPPPCDGCGQPTAELKWCACRLKRYCSKDCQRRDFPAHKAECKAARGVA